MASGKTVTDTAVAIEVTRQTVSEWLNHHPGFHAALNSRRQGLWVGMTDSLRGLLPKALEVLTRELEGEHPLLAAVHVLKACGLYSGIPVSTGPTDPQAIALAMQLKDYERQHAQEDAEIIMQRKHFDRMMVRLAGDPISAGWTPDGSGR